MALNEGVWEEREGEEGGGGGIEASEEQKEGGTHTYLPLLPPRSLFPLPHDSSASRLPSLALGVGHG